MYDIESIYSACSVDDAIDALLADPKAIVIAGGTDILIKVREGKLAGCRLVSIHELEELRGITKNEKGDLLIGPLTCFHDITHNPMIAQDASMLAYAADQVGGPQIRAMGTIGGNISNGVTSADTASSLFAYEAELWLKGSDGMRVLPISEYYTGPGHVCLKPGELLTKIVIKAKNYRNFHGCYIKYAMRNAMDIATLGTAVLVKLNDDKTAIENVRIAFGVANPIPMRAHQAEAALAGVPLCEAIEKITALVRAEINPRNSWRASREFRMQIAGEAAKRALMQAITSAGGVY